MSASGVRSRLPLGTVDVVLEGVGTGEHKVSKKRTYSFRFVGLETGARYRALHTDGYHAHMIRELVEALTGARTEWNPKMIAREGGVWTDFGTSEVIVGPLYDNIPFASFPWADLRGTLMRATTEDVYHGLTHSTPPKQVKGKAFLRTRWERRLTP